MGSVLPRSIHLGVAFFAVLSASARPADCQVGAGQTGAAQMGAAHRLAVEVGGLVQGLDDRMASPVRYTGMGAALGAAYGGETGDWRWAVRAAYAGPRLTSAVHIDGGGFEETAWWGGSAELLRTVWRDSARALTLRAGPGLAAEVGVRRHVYARDNWLNFRNSFMALQAVGQVDLDLGRKGGLSETLAVPLAGVAVRKAYTTVIRRERDVRLVGPQGFLLVRHRLEYRLPGTGGVGARVFHEASMLRHTEPLELATVVHRVGMAIEWRWGSP